MQLFVRCAFVSNEEEPQIRTISLDVDPNDTIQEVKCLVQDKGGVPPEQQSLTLAGDVLEDSKTLSEYKITEDNVLFDRVTWISVRIPSLHKTISINVDVDDTVRDIKAKIENKEGVLVQHQTLYSDLKYRLNKFQPLEDGLHMNDVVENGSRACCYTPFVERNVHQPMTIHVKTLTGKTITLKVASTDLIEDVKVLLCGVEGIAPDHQRLIFELKSQKDDKTLSECNIKDESLLYFVLCLYGAGMPVYVKTHTDEILLVEFESSFTVGQAKAKIQEREGIQSEEQILTFAGKVLSNDKTLGEYNIQKHCTLHLSLRLRPGRVQIYAYLPEGRSMTLTVSLSDSVAHCKYTICTKENRGCIPNHPKIRYREFDILFNKRILKEYTRLEDCGIHKEAMIHILSNNGSLPVCINSFDQEPKQLAIDPDETVLSLKVRISTMDAKMPSASEQQLFLGDTLLEERKLVKAYSISDHSTIVVSVLKRIFIKSSDGNTTKIKIYPHETVDALKRKIQQKDEQHIESHRQQLFYVSAQRCLLLEDGQTIASYSLPSSPWLHLCKDDYLHSQSSEKLSAERRSILWSHHGIEINAAPGVVTKGQEVNIGLKIYNTSSHFVFPEGYSVRSSVYELCVSSTHALPLDGITVSFSNFRQPTGGERCCLMQASRIPVKWERDFTPVYNFHEIKGARFRDRAVDISLKASNCYLAIAAYIPQSFWGWLFGLKRETAPEPVSHVNPPTPAGTMMEAQPSPTLVASVPSASVSVRSELTVERLKDVTKVTDTQLDFQIQEGDLYHLAGYFDNVDDYLETFRLTPGQQTDVKDLTFRRGTQAGMKEALKMWLNPNPYEATFRALVDILVGLKKEDVAVKVCNYLFEKY